MSACVCLFVSVCVSVRPHIMSKVEFRKDTLNVIGKFAVVGCSHHNGPSERAPYDYPDVVVAVTVIYRPVHVLVFSFIDCKIIL